MKIEKNLKKVERILRRGGVGIFPTDTLYGLIGSAFSKKAVRRIYQLRKRNFKKPLIILISKRKDLGLFGVHPDKQTRTVLDALWPGKVSVILPCNVKRFFYLHRATNTLAFRLPRKKALLKLMNKIGPIVAPSANPQGKAPAVTAQKAFGYFGDRVDFYLNGGTLKSKPSTLVAVRNGRVTVKRKGALKFPKRSNVSTFQYKRFPA
ncbi:MAG: threonylcarbamoyl-AMP synthase [Candidatus Ryanbacteria bacterium RIFCSPHIGHO2_02_FULL_45_43]|uniref:L-threonylcarbamoyladenylate synthase n=1 Tax=Candidatus Ryanbacteria bacterium RIFCSPHIGHO2_01_45_13 TaxID=1802112 RepID=A0A1G2G0K4_9BACT|nr:MAG: threonylcarbamoyl-AMP synthase [Candidatus Ryanbacteria bacterium RIFCSPHIGHO2_01_FULL_44_130]OGZ43351.1 MAG: threonylcarbamoyl-AMP synthase [Candidatus Ryanbacteria bacterium RIFCSPHIGHO2_01_45_13]OGZ48925.1 MAG: threonylcarbamoyl-AMP synthase [Candidatus Ryanbacteria bacterium RIFCSPHIGHO2_02_FULL_45_43]OGZ50894.1 MAG: threonylcarbamoyl-AMP synthase [Candidatus Ryanbacteria bacterium RIFCSPHIGHO2_12_FULL_44_20]OGZ51741.1 MAG: threonylcarbamoyl-AMP synthase [Candidatus Ryanbacteria bac